MKSTISVRNFLALGLVGLAALVASCAPREEPPDKLVLSRVSYQSLAGWIQDSQGQALDALRKSCARLVGLPDDRSMGAGGIAGTVAEWRPACEALETVGNGDAAARAYLERWFEPFAAFNNDHAEGLFTGYYEASLNGSRDRSARYATPL